MKVIVFLAILGLSLAGFRADMKKVGHWISKHHQAIETGAEDVGNALKIGAAIASHAEFVNVDGLIQNGIKTVGDATQKKKNVGQLVQDGLKIIGDLTSGNGNSNSEELFSFSDALHDAGDVAGIVGTGLKIADMFGDDQLFSFSDALHDAGDVAGIVGTGLKIADMFGDDQLFSFSDALHDAGDVAGIVGTGLKIADLFSDDQLVNILGLIENGVKTYQDATQKNKNIPQLIQDGLGIVGDLTSGSSSSNSEELFSFSDALHDAGDVAGIVGTGLKIADMFGDDQLFSFSDALHDAGDVAGIVGTGLKIADLFGDDELFNLGQILAGDIQGTIDTLHHDVQGTRDTLQNAGKQIQPAINAGIKGIDYAATHFNTTQALQDANEAATLIGTGLNVANGILKIVNAGLSIAGAFTEDQ